MHNGWPPTSRAGTGFHTSAAKGQRSLHSQECVKHASTLIIIISVTNPDEERPLSDFLSVLYLRGRSATLKLLYIVI